MNLDEKQNRKVVSDKINLYFIETYYLQLTTYD